MRQIHSSAWLLVVLSAVLQVLIFPLPGIYVFSWFALAPLILALLNTCPVGELEVAGVLKLQPATARKAFLLSYVCGILWYAGTCYWIYDTMRQYGGLSAPMAALALFLFCCYLGLYHGVFGLLFSLLTGPQRDYRLALAGAPFLWVAVELARTRITGFPWNLLGIAQVDNSALCRIAGWTGVYGVSFELTAVNVAMAAAFLVPKEKRTAMLVAAIAAAAVLQAGSLIEPPAARADHAAVLVQQNLPVAADWTPAYFQQTLRELADLSVKSTATSSPAKVDLIVWPETPAPFFTNDARFRQTVSTMTQQTGAWAVVGAIGMNNPNPNSDGPMFNSAALVSPHGEWTQRYDKVHLVPFGEYVPFPSLFSFAGGLTQEVGRSAPGTSRKPLDAGGTQLGTFICYESIFPDEVRQFAMPRSDDLLSKRFVDFPGAQVFVNISNDGWYGDSGAYAQHLNQTRMRAIENNRWILSTTDTGVTGSIDPEGRVVARLPRKERLALVAPYALNSATTFYTRHGDWFAYACAIISVGALVLRFLLRNNLTKHKAETSS